MRTPAPCFLVVGLAIAGCSAAGSEDGGVTELAKTAEPASTKTLDDLDLAYAQESKDGRIYVFGTALGHEKWLETGHLPYSYTMIGGGPEGETVVIEIDKDNPALQTRLNKNLPG